jgi:sulfur-oxidizing protein SoxX
MRQTARKIFVSTLSSAAVIGALILAPLPATAAEGASSVVEKGKAVAFDRKKGNCLACHMMDDGTLPGNIGPPLVSMKLRFPDKAKLRAQIWDATVANPNSIMIPFGRHKVLSEEEIDQIVEYVYTL